MVFDMTLIKICGIKNVAEIQCLNKYLPDYAGFVFAQSRRQVTPEKAAGLIRELAPSIKRAGVFVDMEVTRAAEIAAEAGLDVLQLHGNENSDYIKRLR
jgi:phosphoribosylanthranilate isomerase